MLCIGAVGTEQPCSLDDTYSPQLVTLPSLSSASTLKSSSSNATTVTLQPGSEFDSGVDVSYRANAAANAGGTGSSSGYSGFFEGIFGCLRPVWSVIGKATSSESKQKGTSSNIIFLQLKSRFVIFETVTLEVHCPHLSALYVMFLCFFCSAVQVIIMCAFLPLPLLVWILVTGFSHEIWGNR